MRPISNRHSAKASRQRLPHSLAGQGHSPIRPRDGTGRPEQTPSKRHATPQTGEHNLRHNPNSWANTGIAAQSRARGSPYKRVARTTAPVRGRKGLWVSPCWYQLRRQSAWKPDPLNPEPNLGEGRFVEQSGRGSSCRSEAPCRASPALVSSQMGNQTSKHHRSLYPVMGWVVTTLASDFPHGRLFGQSAIYRFDGSLKRQKRRGVPRCIIPYRFQIA